MRLRKSGKRLVWALIIGVAVSLMPVGPRLSHASAASSKKCARLSARPRPVRSPELVTDIILEWNQQAAQLALSTAAALAPIQQTRAMAIFQLAVHDAVNGITGKYETYLSSSPAPENASPDAAAVAAAHYALKNLFQGNDTTLDALFLNSLASHGLSPVDPGIDFGRSAAAAILAARANDHSAQAQFDYVVPGAGQPGVWIRLNNAPAQLPGWGNVTPFVLRSGSQFRPDAPPALDSDQYTKDYNEIKEIGRSTGSTRSAEQSNIATFWRASPTAIWNSVLTQIVPTRNLDLSDEARLFALFYIAAADASIACWDAKYTYNFWRPQLAIRGADLDGNDLTVSDPAWLPFVPTPPHPEYPSGHASNSSAMAKILISEFDDNPGVPIVVTATGVTRHWNTFSEAVDEVIDARVYSGIHFRNSDEVGARMGRQVAQFVSKHALRRCPHSH